MRTEVWRTNSGELKVRLGDEIFSVSPDMWIQELKSSPDQYQTDIYAAAVRVAMNEARMRHGIPS